MHASKLYLSFKNIKYCYSAFSFLPRAALCCRQRLRGAAAGHGGAVAGGGLGQSWRRGTVARRLAEAARGSGGGVTRRRRWD